jgi:transposase
MFPTSIFPYQQLLNYEFTQQIGSCFHLVFSSKQAEPQCPLCSTPAQRVHSHYGRSVADLPVAGYQVRLELQVRKFFCDKPSCPRWVFCERLPDVARPYERRSIRLSEALQHLALLASAEVGHRVASKFGIHTSPDSLLRLARGRDEPNEKAEVHKVGIDDWAKRKGHNYGTIIVDLERGCPIELLPDREASTLTDWLEAHPQIELITRDRATCYAEACTLGAPQAQQIADLWHLLKNLFEAVERYIAGQHKTLNAALEQAACEKEALEAPETTPASPPPSEVLAPAAPASPKPPTCRPEQQTSRRAWRQERFEKIKCLQAKGCSNTKIAEELGLHRVTIGKYLAAAELPEHGNQGRQRKSLLDPFKDYLRQRHAEGCTNATRLFRELRAQGYAGGLTILKDYLRELKQTLSTEKAANARKPITLPAPKTLAWWLLCDPERLKAEQLALLSTLLTHLPNLKQAAQLAQEGWQVFRERKQADLKGWMAKVKSTGFAELKRFVKGLELDLQAVQNALCYSWSNGVTEGNVNRLKMIKRSMFGRANFDLLRAKVLYRG